MLCDCGQEMRQIPGESQTLVGFGDHDDNCVKRRYHCSACDTRRTEALQRRCLDCGWVGKAACSCHGGTKVETWTDAPHNEAYWHGQSSCGCNR